METKVESKDELTSYLNSISVLLLFLLFLSLPILFVTFTTEFFILPKQILTAAVVFMALVIFAIKMIIKPTVRLRRTIFDLPIILFCVALLLSSLFAVNRFDSLIVFVPFLFAALLFFTIVNVVRNKNSFFLLIGSLTLGGILVSIMSILSFFKIYLLPFPMTQAQIFTPLGSLFDQAIYLSMLLPIAIVIAIRLRLTEKQIVSTDRQDQIDGIVSSPVRLSLTDPQNDNIVKRSGFLIISIILIIGFLLTIYQLFSPSAGSGQRLTILPFQTGFQTAMAAISQDTGGLIKGFFLGSGFGTYLTDFTRFKQATFNQNDVLWALTFVRSSSFALEILATAGILGLLSFVFLTTRIVKNAFARNTLLANPISISLILSILVLFLLPVGFTIQGLFFILLALFSVYQGFKTEEQKRFFDIELQLIASKRGLFNVETLNPLAFSYPQPSIQNQKGASRILPSILFIIIFIFVVTLGFFSVSYLISDMEFQSSLVAASQNKGQETYRKQSNAISIFPYRDGYYRIFSQTNLALANSLANQQPQGATLSATTQQTIYTLIQQSINAGRTATTISPQTSLNWQNLSSIYRSLIGFGRNAENFAIVTAQQAVRFDPNNPQGYIILGGIYYQLGLWENAQNQFQIAVNLKSDFANAHYNLGHALKSKGDLSNALREFQIAKGLVANEKDSLRQITLEIEALQNKLEERESPQTTSLSPTTTTPLNISSPSAQLPRQNPPVEIPPPTSATTSARE